MEQQAFTGLPTFSPGEACNLRLRALFERRGYSRIIPPKFEEYALFFDNKDFLGTDQMLTFMDYSGRLMALKPDVTLSIAKNIPSHPLDLPEKLYYIDDVVRYSPEHKDYKVLEQIGLERIGREDGFANLEVLDLALRALALMGEESAMDISHLGFISGLLEDLPPRLERDIIECIHAKNTHDIASLLESNGITGQRKESILTLASLHGPFPRELERARHLIRGPGMEQAYRELESLTSALQPGLGQAVNLDFSVVNNLDYYNGLIFRGYIRGIPGVVCTGGRYDNLMKRLGKESAAIGFAIYLHQLEGYYARYVRQTDVLLTYPKTCDWGALLRKAEELEEQGMKVRCERDDADFSRIPHARRIDYEGKE